MTLILVAILFVYTFIKIYLELLQANFIKAELKKPSVVLSQEDYEKAGKIGIYNKYYESAKLAIDFIVMMLWIFWGFKVLFNFFNENELIFVLGFIIINMFINLPFSIFESFYKDKKFGFSNVTAKIFIIDFIKSLVLTLIFAGIFIWCAIKFINFFPQIWWLLLFIVSFIIIVVINLIYPTIIAPIFNKMTPLEDNELKSSIEELLQKCGFKSSGVFTMDASKRDNRLNAYFGGLGFSKRVVLFDTLIAKLSLREIIAVLGHELGHFKHLDIYKNIATMAIVLFVMFLVFGNIPQNILAGLNLNPNSASSIIIFFLVFSPVFNFIVTPILSFFSRLHEFGADEFGASTTNKKDMIDALKKLASENKAFPKAQSLYAKIYLSHPTIFERIKKLESI